MNEIGLYTILFGIIVAVGQLFRHSTIPLSLLLVIAGILLSFIPFFPKVQLSSEVVLNVFLPLLIYKISAFSSWKDIQKSVGAITSLAVGHVIFITIIIAIIIHTLMPEFDWPLAFVLGAVLSPTDDVAFVAIAEKMNMPEKIFTILEGESMFNSSTALILFRFALAAVITQEVSALHAVSYFFIVIICEALYGLAIGYLIGELRLHIEDPVLHIVMSLLTPFIAYLPAELLGGSGILSTIVTGFVIGDRYAYYFQPEFRLFSRYVWPTVSFGIQSILFLLVGLNMGFIWGNVSILSSKTLLLFSSLIIAGIILGRFFWVFVVMRFIPWIFSSRSKHKHLPWQYSFIIAWSGMRGGISLAAVLAVPVLPVLANGVNSRNILIFLTISVIAVTLILQGTTLPWLLKIMGVHRYGEYEKHYEKIHELSAREAMAHAGLRWLEKYKKRIDNNQHLLNEVKAYIREYQTLTEHIKEEMKHIDKTQMLEDPQTLTDEIYILSRLIEVERDVLLRLWREEKINLTVRDKLLNRLDHRFKHVLG